MPGKRPRFVAQGMQRGQSLNATARVPNARACFSIANGYFGYRMPICIAYCTCHSCFQTVFAQTKIWDGH
jgi:hypothetical protein